MDGTSGGEQTEICSVYLERMAQGEGGRIDARRLISLIKYNLQSSTESCPYALFEEQVVYFHNSLPLFAVCVALPSEIHLLVLLELSSVHFLLGLLLSHISMAVSISIGVYDFPPSHRTLHELEDSDKDDTRSHISLSSTNEPEVPSVHGVV
jgi:hypothetical protein